MTEKKTDTDSAQEKRLLADANEVIASADKLIIALLAHRKSGSKASAKRVHDLVVEYEAKTGMKGTLREIGAAAPSQDTATLRALKECYVDLGALLNATTWELAPGVRAQLQKTHDLAQATLGEVRSESTKPHSL